MSIVVEAIRRHVGFMVVVTLAITITGLPAIISEDLLPYLIGAIVLSGIALLSLIRPRLLLYVVILTSVLTDLFRSFDSLSLGKTSFTLSGFRWVFVAAIALLVLAVNIRRVRLPGYALPFAVFVLWVTSRWVSTSLSATGAKDILFYSLPPLIGVYTLLVLSIGPRRLPEQIESALSLSTFIPLFLYIAFIPVGLVELTTRGPVGLLSPRAIAQYLLVILSLSLAQWRYRRWELARARGVVISLLALGLILFTLSRTATVTALLLFAMFRLNSIKLWKLALSGILAVMLSASVLLGVPSFRARLFHQPPSSLSEALAQVNVMGRDKMWPVTFNHAIKNPILGWGPGSARPLVAQITSKQGVNEWHPHNEYLQVFHDTGLIGLVLLLFAWLSMFFRYWKRWKLAHLSGDMLRAKWNMAATLGIVIVLVNSVADNTLHYANVLGPLFLIIGCTDFLNGSREPMYHAVRASHPKSKPSSLQ